MGTTLNPFQHRLGECALSARVRALCLTACFSAVALGQVVDSRPPRDQTSSIQDLLGIPYVPDGALDEQGRWTLFSRQDLVLRHPGLNCSGLTIALAQRLLGPRSTLERATRDRLGDSGKNSRLGQDWDFGWDLVLNLSDGLARTVLLPSGPGGIEGDGTSLRGFASDDASAWTRLLPRLRSDRVYLATLSRERPGHRVQHYHTAVLLRDGKGAVWFYQTLPEGLSHRLNLSSSRGMERMQGMFGSGKRILVLEVEPPGTRSAHP
jgi:hypothetical protein